MPIKNLEQLKGLRKNVKHFSKGLVTEGNKDKTLKFLQQPEEIFSEAAWIQLLFLLKFWMDDNSAQFESTDVAIEKSVNTVFDVFKPDDIASLYKVSLKYFVSTVRQNHSAVRIPLLIEIQAQILVADLAVNAPCNAPIHRLLDSLYDPH